MKKTAALLTTALFTAAFSASGVETPEVGAGYLVGLSELGPNEIYAPTIRSASRQASGSIDRVYFDEDGEVEALRIKWSRGLLQSEFELTQPVERFAYDPRTNTIYADANAERLANWAAEDAADEQFRGGVDINRISPGRLNGERVLDETGREIGRVVNVSTDTNGNIQTLTFARQSGWIRTRIIRGEVPARQARWSNGEQAVRLIAQPSA
ncbi:MAG: hypothetical protein DHS20C06_08060 [Hyphobacterium sp.]|nr:MAG: hypothetical protein DHS20C06_08060 [Hyphobacterium sp.]